MTADACRVSRWVEDRVIVINVFYLYADESLSTQATLLNESQQMPSQIVSYNKARKTWMQLDLFHLAGAQPIPR